VLDVFDHSVSDFGQRSAAPLAPITNLKSYLSRR
jgi:hypothetical protein